VATSSTKREAKGRPCTKFKGQDRSRPDLGSGLATWQVSSDQKPTKEFGRGRCPHTRSPLKSLAQMTSKPTSDDGCDPIKSLVASLPQVSRAA
jgi:hypothetical protein